MRRPALHPSGGAPGGGRVDARAAEPRGAGRAGAARVSRGGLSEAVRGLEWAMREGGGCARTSAGGGTMWGRDRDALTGGVSSSRVGCGRLTPGTDPAPIGPRTISRGRLRLCTETRCLRYKTVEGVWCAVVCAEQYTVCVDAREFCVSSVAPAPCALRVLLLRFNTQVSWFTTSRCETRLMSQTHATCIGISFDEFGPSERFPSFSPFLFRCRRRAPIARNRDCARALHLAGVISS